MFFQQAILGLGGPQFKQICKDVKEMTLDNNDKELLMEIVHSEKSSTFVPKGLQSKHTFGRQVSELNVLPLGLFLTLTSLT